MMELLVLDRGQGKTTQAVDLALSREERWSTVPYVVVDEMSARFVFDLLLRRSPVRADRNRMVVAFRIGSAQRQIYILTERRMREGGRGVGHELLIVDDVDRFEHGIYTFGFSGYLRIFATASPNPRTLADLEATERAIRKERRQHRRWLAEQNRRAGEVALMKLATQGHRVEGIDPERFGDLLSRWPSDRRPTPSKGIFL